MDIELWQQADRLLEQVLDLAEDARAPFLEQLSAENPALHQLLSDLLAADEGVVAFLEQPLVDVMGTQREELAPGAWVDRFQIVREIGRGGLSVVYLAQQKDAHFQRQVALKVLKRGMDTDDIVARFHRERHILASFNHPNIAPLLDAGVTPDGRPYFAMPYIQGLPVTRWCREKGCRPRHRLALFAQICDVVAFAHRALVVHRDLKPSNILVTEEGEPMLLDFGIAGVLSPDGEAKTATQTAQRMFTPEYASPQQVRGEPVRTSCDVYALGVLLFELLVGRRPYEVNYPSAAQYIEAVCRQVPSKASTAVVKDRPEDHLPEYDGKSLSRLFRGDLDTITAKALEKEEHDRYAGVSQLASDVRAYLGGFPIKARAPKASYTLLKWLLRHKFAAGVSLAALLASLAFTVKLVHQNQTIRRERDRVEAARLHAEQERDKSQHIATFLTQLFTRADPLAPVESGLPEREAADITARSLLDRAAGEIVTGLQDSPQTKAGLLDTMGVAYLNLGLADEARPLLSQGLVLREQTATHEGGAGRDLASSLEHMALLHFVQDADYGEAETYLYRAQALRLGLDGPCTEEIARLQVLLGRMRFVQGRFAEAWDEVHEALAVYEFQGTGGKVLADTLLSLGDISYRQGRYGEAEPLLQRALALYVAVLSDNHPAQAQAMSSLGALYLRTNRLEPAYRLAEEAVRILETSLGPEHHLLIDPLKVMAATSLYGKRLPESERLMLRAYALCERHFGPLHHQTVIMLGNMGEVYKEMRQFAKAESFHRRALDARRKIFPADHPGVALSLQQYSEILNLQDKREGVEEMLREALRIRRLKLGDHPWTAATLHSLAYFYQRGDQPKQAVPLYLESIAIREKVYGVNARFITDSCLQLSIAYRDLGQLEEAEQYGGRALELRARDYGETHGAILDALEHYARVLDDLGRLAEADQHKERARRIRKDAD